MDEPDNLLSARAGNPEQKMNPPGAIQPDVMDVIAALASRVMRLEAMQKAPPTFRECFWVEITGSDSAGTYAWKEKYNTGSGLVDYAGGRVSGAVSTDSAATEINGWKWLPNGTKALCLAYDMNDKVKYSLIVPIPPPPNDSGTDYILAYDGTGKNMAWIETTTDCPSS